MPQHAVALKNSALVCLGKHPKIQVGRHADPIPVSGDLDYVKSADAKRLSFASTAP